MDITEETTVISDLPADTEVHFFMSEPDFTDEFVSTPFARVTSSSSWTEPAPVRRHVS